MGTSRNLRIISTLYIRRTQSIIGTYKIGTVTDPELRVPAAKNLRAADAFTVPYILSAKTNGPAIMISEKTSDMMKRTFRIGHLQRVACFCC
jgi:choline dehydrogenase-like flavoprotein